MFATGTAPHRAGRPDAPRARGARAQRLVALAAVVLVTLSACAGASTSRPGDGTSSARGAGDRAPREVPSPDPETCPSSGEPAARRVAGADRITTAVALAEDGWAAGGAPTVVLASARAFPDALAASPWAAAHDAPLLLTEPEHLPGAVAAALDRLGTDEVVVVGGEAAVSEAVLQDLRERSISVRRLAGDGRAATAAAIATDLHDAADEVVVVAADGFADAVAAGPLVVRGSFAPVVLTGRDALPDSTRRAITELGAQRATLVGGTAAIGPDVAAELDALGLDVQRIAGADRYDTSAAVVREAAVRHGGRDAVAAVTGADYPDALAGNAYAARTDATVLLVAAADLIDHPPTRELLASSGPAWRCVTVIGGAGAVAVRVAEQVVSFTGAPPPDGHPVLLAAGDIASCGLRSDDATGALLDGLGGTIVTLGDNVYPEGTTQQYRDCWRPAWGRHHVRTRVALGNHDIRTDAGSPTYDEFGVRAGPAGDGWHAVDLGPHWRLFVLNSNCPGTVRCDVDSDQYAWLREQLERADDRHTIVATHHPRWSSGAYAPGEARVADLWELAAAHGVDVWLAGHEHGYERFAPKDAAGAAAPDGIQHFIAGTGGASLRAFGDPQPDSQAQVVAHGVLELTLRPDGYGWRFVTLDGSTRDSGDRSR